MNSLKWYYNKQVKRRLFLKFFYINLLDIPKVKAIEICFNLLKTNEKILTSAILALEMCSIKFSSYKTKPGLDIYIKIRKGYPVSCKIVLTRKRLNVFLKSLLKKKKTILDSSFSYLQKKIRLKYSAALINDKIKSNYLYFRQLPELHVKIHTNSKNPQEVLFLIKLYKFII